MKDMYAKGRGIKPRRGEQSPNAVLSDKDVKTIRLSVSMGCKQMFLAEKYGVCQPHISLVANFKTR